METPASSSTPSPLRMPLAGLTAGSPAIAGATNDAVRVPSEPASAHLAETEETREPDAETYVATEVMSDQHYNVRYEEPSNDYELVFPIRDAEGNLETLEFEVPISEVREELVRVENELVIRDFVTELVETISRDQAGNPQEQTVRGERAARRARRRSKRAMRSLTLTSRDEVGLDGEQRWSRRAEKQQRRLQIIYEGRI